VKPTTDKISESRLIWCGHIKKKDINGYMWRCERINISDCKMDKVRAKKKLREVIRQNM